jgi:hypothetical protein
LLQGLGHSEAMIATQSLRCDMANAPRRHSRNNCERSKDRL